MLDVTRTPTNVAGLLAARRPPSRGSGGTEPPQEQGPGPYGPIRYHIDLNYYYNTLTNCTILIEITITIIFLHVVPDLFELVLEYSYELYHICWNYLYYYYNM